MITPAPTDADGDDSCPHCGHEVGDSWLVCAWCGEQLAVPAELSVGARVGDGRYQILRVIGRGGFGITYDVGDRRLQRRVAMKELFPESAVRHGSMVLTPPQGRPGFKLARERFLREARVLARFTHPGIVRVYEVFEEHGTAYLVMELLDGRTLVELLQQRGKPFPEAEVLDVAGRVAAALRPVHAAGVLHRDVNPSNVMLTRHGRIVVIDFGLARDYDQDETRGMTRVVTPGYAPLEQYRGEGRFGPSTDVYGLAATCYRLATGRVPVSAVERDAGAVLPSPCALNPAISKATSDAILDGLELEPTHRPQDLDAFLARLGASRLPEGPRSPLIDLVPPPEDEPEPASSGPSGDGMGVGPVVAAPAAAEATSPGASGVSGVPASPALAGADASSGADRAQGQLPASDPDPTRYEPIVPRAAESPGSPPSGSLAAPVGGPAGFGPGPGAGAGVGGGAVVGAAAGSVSELDRGEGSGIAGSVAAVDALGAGDDATRHEPIRPRGTDDRRDATAADRAGARTSRPPVDATTPVGGGTSSDRTWSAPSAGAFDASGPGASAPGASVPGASVAGSSVPGASVSGTGQAGASPTIVARTELPPPRFRPSRAPADVAVLEPRYRVVDGLPRPVGGHPVGRRRVLLPLALVAVAAGSAAPVIVVALMVIVFLPAIATMGDSAAHRLRGEHGVAGGWAERRMSSGALAAPRFARNVVLSVGRSLPVVIGAGMGLLGRYGLENLGANRIVLDGTLRLIGAVAVGALVLGARHGSARFRSGMGTEELVVRIAPGQRVTERIVVLWIVAAFLVAGALWLTPSPFPLP